MIRTPLLPALPVLLALLSAPLTAQDGNDEAPRDAAALLEAAIAHQNPAGRAVDVRDYEGRMNFHWFEDAPEGEPPARNEGKATQLALLLANGGKEMLLYRRTVESTVGGAVTTVAFDGLRYWVEDDRGRRILRGRDAEVEKKNVVDEVERTRRLLRHFFLENLRTDPAHLVLRERLEALKVYREQKPCRVVERTVPGERKMIFWIDAKDCVVRRIVVEASAGSAEEDYWFAKHRRLPDSGILVPLTVTYYENGVKRLEADSDDPTAVRFGFGEARLTARDFAFPGAAAEDGPRAETRKG